MLFGFGACTAFGDIFPLVKGEWMCGERKAFLGNPWGLYFSGKPGICSGGFYRKHSNFLYDSGILLYG